MRYRIDVHCHMVVHLDVEAPSSEVAEKWAQSSAALSYIEGISQEAYNVQVHAVTPVGDWGKVDVLLDAQGKEVEC